MAGVLRPSIDWNIRSHPVNSPASTSKTGFGFGLAHSYTSRSENNSPIPSSSSHENAAPTARAATKRRFEADNEADNDDSMDRSPTPERPKRAIPKRTKVSSVDSKGTIAKDSDGRKNTEDIDVGMLLASLPQQSYLPLLIELITKHPSIKLLLFPLIPRPSIQIALQAVEDSAKKLRDAYPYSNATASLPSVSYSAIGSGYGFGSFQAQNVSHSFRTGGSTSFGATRDSLPDSSSDGMMRESYIQSRLRTYVDDFVATSMSYIHYFSSVDPPPTSGAAEPAITAALSPTRATPTETYTLLAALNGHILSQPHSSQTMLTPLLLPRLVDEWRAWLNRIDAIVNQEGGMFGSEVANTWSRELDRFADVKIEGWEVMRQLRDAWVSRVGWLVGRKLTETLEMEEEL